MSPDIGLLREMRDEARVQAGHAASWAKRCHTRSRTLTGLAVGGVFHMLSAKRHDVAAADSQTGAYTEHLTFEIVRDRWLALDRAVRVLEAS